MDASRGIDFGNKEARTPRITPMVVAKLVSRVLRFFGSLRGGPSRQATRVVTVAVHGTRSSSVIEYAGNDTSTPCPAGVMVSCSIAVASAVE